MEKQAVSSSCLAVNGRGSGDVQGIGAPQDGEKSAERETGSTPNYDK
jgi:hypothetical protein